MGLGLFILLMGLVLFASAIILASNFLGKLHDDANDPNWTSHPGGTGFQFINSKGVVYYLHLDKKLTAKGKVNQLYFFSRDQMENAVPLLPDGYEVRELSNGLPILKLKT